MGLEVPVPHVAPRKCSGTQGTLVWPFSGVRSNMNSEVCCLVELLCTVIAAIRTFPSMYPGVTLEVILRRECHRAVGALVRPHTEVNVAVPHEVVLLVENFGAQVTHMELLAHRNWPQRTGAPTTPCRYLLQSPSTDGKHWPVLAWHPTTIQMLDCGPAGAWIETWHFGVWHCRTSFTQSAAN